MFVAIRLSPLAKNVPQRNRCGYKFTHEPAIADLTDDQIEEIRNDAFLKICNFPSVGWFQAFGIARTEKNEKKWKDHAPTLEDITKAQDSDDDSTDLKNCRMAVVLDAPSVTPTNKGKTSVKPNGDNSDDAGNKDQGNKPTELSASSPRDVLVKALEKRGKKEGKDFDGNAKSEALFAYLKTL